MKAKIRWLILMLAMALALSFCTKSPSKDELNKALLKAAHDGTAKETEELLGKGADIDAKNEYGSDSFKIARVNSNIPVVELYLQRGKVPSDEDMMSAAANGRKELLKLLLRYAKPSGIVLMSATKDTEIFMLLLNHGADIFARDDYDRTVLHWAALRGTEEVVKFLCQKGLDPYAKDKGGNTPVSNAEGKGRVDIVGLLKQCRK